MGVPLSKWVMIEEASDTAATRKLPYPVLDADNHLYETEEPFTNYLPKEYQGANKYVQVDNRRKIAIRGQISEFIPNPTFEVVARPWGHGGVLQARQPRRQEPARDFRRTHL